MGVGLVILSTTRPDGRFGLGFVSDSNCMNVSLSRAKCGQVTMGHKDMGKSQHAQGPLSFGFAA